MILFKNKGLLDLTALQTFGLSSKTDQEKIGRFGTGLKYAMAVIARLGGKVTIITGGRSYSITANEEIFRGQTHTRLMLEGEPLAFTTALGRDWEPWMAFRELYANALDEGGSIDRSEGIPKDTGDTVIAVELNEFEAIYFSIEEHFIVDEEPIWAGEGLEVYAGKSQFVFYRGIAIMKLNKPSAQRYNILSYLNLTEDRTAKYEFQVRASISRHGTACDNVEVAKNLADERNPFESKLDFIEDGGEPSEVFLGAAASLGSSCSPSAGALVKASMPDDKSYTNIISKTEPGGAQIIHALGLLRELGEDLTDINWVLAAGTRMLHAFQTSKKTAFISEHVFNDQSAMNLAVFSAYAEMRGHDWMARKLMKIALKDQEAA